MTLSTGDAVRDVYNQALRQSLARSLRTAGDWDRCKAIIQEASTRIELEQAAHARDYQARITEAQEIILREEHGIRLDQPLPPGVDKFSDKDSLLLKAETRVRTDYDRRIAAIKADELDQYRELTNAIRTRDAVGRTRSQTPSQSRAGPSQS